MGAYRSLAQLGYIISGILDYGAVLFHGRPDLEKIYQSVHRKIHLFQVFMERLDLSSRIVMEESFVRVQEAASVFVDALESYGEESLDIDFDNIEMFREDSNSFIATLEEIEEEYQKQHTTHSVESKMLGLSDVCVKVKNDIFGYWRDEVVFSLVGMAGIGKTALAHKLFHDLDILEWFDSCAWVTIGREYQPQEVIQIILAQLEVDDDEMKCFIVLDDLWDMEIVLECLETITLGEGSRILVTTRIQHQYSFSYHLIHIRLLNEQESLNLLCDKIFAQNSCPVELEKAVKMIAEKCDGLPLTIITVANLLSKTPRSQWIEVAERKRHQLFIDAYDEISEVLYPSFDNLRKELKLCFIYMGVFPLKHKIPKSKLINLWIVEKLIGKEKFQSLEISSVECLQYLALQNIVMVYQRSSTPMNDQYERIKTCGLHSSWWYFCNKQARKDKFFHVLDSDTDASKEVIEGQSRLTIHNNVLFGIKVVYKSMEENCASTTHSLLCLGPYHQYPVPICFGLKLLKKFDALNIRFYKFPLEVLELVKLRYLAITCNASLPSSISKLRKLQYFIVHRHLIVKFGAPSYLPVEIWDMKRLKYLYIMSSDLPYVSDVFLPNLETLLDVSFNSCTNGLVGRLPSLKKLGIRVDLMPDAKEPLCCFDHVYRLSDLESLKYVIVNPACSFEVVAPHFQLSMFPLNLKKLYLSGLGYRWIEISTISSLPNLEVLKLRNNAFRGPLWEVEKDKFPKLFYLQMEDIDLEILEGEECFKCLTKLSIKHCYKLKKLRLTLKDEVFANLEVVDCNPRIQKNIIRKVLNSDVVTVNSSTKFLYSWNS